MQSQNYIILSEIDCLPKTTEYNSCIKVLEILYEQYRWKETESGGVKSMIYSKNQLLYYALLLESWINSKSLKYLIERTIKYFYNDNSSRAIYFLKMERNEAGYLIKTMISI